MDRWQAITAFWGSFGIPSYEENAVPDLKEVTFPYITYQAVSAPFDEDAHANASIWTRSTSWKPAAELSDAVESRLKNGGQVIYYAGGMIWITAETPFAQNMGDPNDDRIKRKLLSVVYHFA